MNTQEKYLCFLKSALTEENPFIKTNEIIEWIQQGYQLIKRTLPS